MPILPDSPTPAMLDAVERTKQQIRAAHEAVKRMPKASQMNMRGRFVVEDMDD